MSAVFDDVQVLLVDGDAAFRERAAAALEGTDDQFEVVRAASVADGVDPDTGGGFDCVVAGADGTDDAGVTFPDGLESDPAVPVLAVVDDEGDQTASDALAAGAVDCVGRATAIDRPSVFATRVRNAVARARQTDDEACRRRLDALFEDPNLLVGLLAPDGTLVDANETALGYVDADRADVTGERFWETPWWSAEVRPTLREKVERAADGERVTYEADLVGSGGQAYSVEGVIRPVTDPSGAVRSLVVSARDVTDSRNRRQELERRTQRLEEFAEILTHDLQNPLTIASSYLEILKESPDEEAIGRCESALERMESLIEEVQTSVLHGRTEPEERPVDLAAVARDAWSTADTRSATLEVEGDLRLRADPDQFRRLLENLFQNAVEHGSTSPRSSSTREDAVEHGSTSPPSASPQEDAVEHGTTSHADTDGSGEATDLTVRVVALEDGFAVDDDGVGLPSDVDDVFERGYTTSQEGTGFGLSIVRNIAENHGWQVSVGESPAGGARFRFSQVLRSAESVVEMEAGGDDIWDRADQGHFYYEAVDDGFDVRVNVPLVEDTHTWAKGGIMVRASTDAESRHVMIRRRPSGATTVQWRPHDGLEARSLTSDLGHHQQASGVGEPHHDWLRLTREGDTFRAYSSETGEEDDWRLLTELTASEVQMPREALVGIAGTSHNRAERATIRFKQLTGADPTHSEDVGDPIRSGSVTAIQPTAVAVREPSAVGPTSVTVRGAVESAEPVADLAVRFEYREVTADAWTATDPVVPPESGRIRAEIAGLDPRRYYEYRVVAEYGDATLVSNGTRLVATPSESPGATETGPRSRAPFDPEDGFADVAPWLDDDTPVVRVTEPDRDQLARALSVDGPRVVAFETSGTIDLEAGDLTVTNDRCWVAGQTAPSPGVTLVRGGLVVAADDCVVQHLRVRPGDAVQADEDGSTGEAIRTGEEAENVVVDHCTATWGVAETQSIGQFTDGTTVSNCLVAEGLRDSPHAEGDRAFGTLVDDHARRVALVGNLWAHNCGWNPRLKDDARATLANNVRYHYDGGVEVDGGGRATVEGEMFARPMGDEDVSGTGAAYVVDCDHERGDGGLAVDDRVRRLTERPAVPDGFEPTSAGKAFEAVLEHAGARPADRTDHDERVVEGVRTGGGGIVDNQEGVGGYPELPRNHEPLSVPTRNLRAWLREQARAVEP